MAAELALSSVSGKPPAFARDAARLLDSKNFNPRATSELATAMATLRLVRGDARQSRRLFRTGLEDPTENSVAQANWAATQVGGLEIARRRLSVPRSFEARATTAQIEGRWPEALHDSLLWLGDQPFSSRPAISGSYVASLGLEDYEESARIALLGLIANPGEPTLANNLAFALARLDRVSEARRALMQAVPLSTDRIGLAVMKATNGLIAMRGGLVDQGRELYREALDEIGAHGTPRQFANALVNWASEELRVRSEAAPDLVATAREAAERVNDVSIDTLVARLEPA
jgi:tetratricopeptide (TPR) repeat protein